MTISILFTWTLFILISTVQHLSKQWKSNKTDNLEPLMLTINPQSEVFISKFDQIQDEIETLASMDELLSGNSYL